VVVKKLVGEMAKAASVQTVSTNRSAQAWSSYGSPRIELALSAWESDQSPAVRAAELGIRGVRE
jgi:hypothetical protein